jgi:hypothetical protein
MIIGIVSPTLAQSRWDLFAPMLDKSVPYSGGRYELKDMFDQIQSGEQHLWLVSDGEKPLAAFTTRIIHYPQFKALSCQFCGGENRMDEWIDDADTILARFAQDGGCAAIEMTGRAGWSRKLPDPWFEEFRIYRRPVLTHDQLQALGDFHPPPE